MDLSHPETWPTGATPLPDGRTAFRVWAPHRPSMAVEIIPLHGERSRTELTRGEAGYYHGIAPARPGDRYLFLLDSWISRPDPASRFQPEGVHGPSEIVDPAAWSWTDHGWTGVRREDLVLYEVHVGAWTREGTFRAALDRLDEVIRLGATAIELLPLAQTPGRWNWGYDGVDLFAPQHEYGSPGDLAAFVDACHQRGLAVILDVVYNHLGPEGNYLGEFAPYFSRRHRTPWGPAFDFDGPGSRPVRDFVTGNALYWLEAFHLDGLRLDAIHFMQDESEPSIVHELRDAVYGHDFRPVRPVHLIAEANIHDDALEAPVAEGGAGYDLLWNDEIPHAIFSIVLGQDRVADRHYRGGPDLRQALDRGYVFRRNVDTGRTERAPEDAPRALFDGMLQGLQTHDQIGNHPEGLRLHAVSTPEIQRAAAALILLHPAAPMLFMGEEFAAPTPFCFFVDFGDDHLRRAVLEGRRRDYDHHDWDRFVSPVAEEAFHRSKLCLPDEGDAGMLRWYRALIALRKDWRRAGLLERDAVTVRHDPGRQLFELAYQSAGQRVWVAARLHPPAEAAEPILLQVEGEFLLHSAWERFGGNEPEHPGQPIRLGCNAAAAGTGTLSSSHLA